MKALVLNGSPRKNGNTAYVCEVTEGLLREKYPGIEVSIRNLQELSVAPCAACGACKRNGGSCVVRDDGAALAAEAEAADVLVFASPVYQSGVSAQLKLAIDRMYSIGGRPPVKEQRAYVVVTGADALESEHYSLIQRQFALLCPWEGWQLRGFCAFSAAERNELRTRGGVAEKLAAMLNG